MSASRLRTAAEALPRLKIALMICLVGGCQPAAPPAKPAAPVDPAPPPSASEPSDAPAPETVPKEDASQKVVVFAAASTQEPVEAIAKEFQRSHPGVEISTSFASSATLAKQIIEGAPADLFLSANPEWVHALEENKLIAERKDLLGNELAVVVPADSTLSLAKPDDLLRDDVEHIALGDPESVPGGIYAKQALVKLGLWEKVRDKVVAAGDVREALAMVETGAAEAGIVYTTDVAASQKVKLALPLASDLTEPIVYPLALIKQEGDNPAAAEFYRYLQSQAAAALFRQAGFRVQQAAGVPSP